MKTKQHPGLVYLSFCMAPFLIGIAYLLALYPAIMSFDSVHQWDQLSNFNFTDWHPAYHTILMWLITRVWHSPSTIALFQVIVYSLVLGYGLYTFRSQFSTPYSLLILLGAVITMVPINGIMVITLWKDVLYSILVLLLTIYILKIISSNGNWVAHNYNWVCLGLVVGNISLLRHNGFPVGFGTLIICMLFFRPIRYFVGALAIALSLLVLVSGPVYRLFNVDKSTSQSVGVIFIHPIAAQINSGTSLTRSEQEFLTKIFPLEGGWPYDCHDASVLFYEGVRFQPVREFPLYTADLFFNLTLRNPAATINHFICLSSFVWQVEQPQGVQLETILASNIDVGDYSTWKVYQNTVVQRPKLPALRETIISAIEYSYAIDSDRMLWRPAIYFYVFTIAVFMYYLRSKNKLIFVLLVPVLIQSSIIALTAQLQALRYQYPMYITSMLFSVPLVYASLKSRARIWISDTETSYQQA